MNWVATAFGYVWNFGSAVVNTVTSSVTAGIAGIIAVIKTDINMFIKALCILVMFVSSLTVTYGVLTIYLSSCNQILIIVSSKDTPYLAYPLALFITGLITYVCQPILSGFSKFSTIALPCATLLVLGYQEQAYAFYNAVMRFSGQYPAQAINSDRRSRDRPINYISTRRYRMVEHE